MNNPMNNLIIVGSVLIILYIFTQKIQNENISESNNIFSNDKDQIIKIFIKKSEEEIQLEAIGPIIQLMIQRAHILS